MEVGAVAAMRYVTDGIKAARLVMQHTEHTLLVGENASEFAISMGLPGPTSRTYKPEFIRIYREMDQMEK
jgi:N4-(beta-N-acetylglucosaminyl)-L-asparaginase